MNPVSIQVPDGARLTNHLYPTTSPDYLLSDLVTIALPNGCYVDLGWYPEHQPNGQFIVRAFYQHWGEQLIPPVACSSWEEAARIASQVAYCINKPIQYIGQSNMKEFCASA